MLNQVVLVGRIVRDLQLVSTEKTKMTYLTLAIPRSYKNVNGEYESDFIECTLWKGIAENTIEYCHKGDLIGVKGRLQSSIYEKDGKTVYSTNVIAEKITFLSTNQTKNVET